MTEARDPAQRPNRRHRKAIPATCALHQGPMGFANLLVSLHGRSVVFDPHVILTEWLG